MQALENDIGRRPAAELKADLDEIEAGVAGVHVPLSYADELYSLRAHIAMVRSKALGDQQVADSRSSQAG